MIRSRKAALFVFILLSGIRGHPSDPKRTLIVLHTVFPHIVSAETILFWILPYVLWPLITVHKCAETIQGRKLFKGGNYMRKYGMYILQKLSFRYLYEIFFLLQIQKKHSFRETILRNTVVKENHENLDLYFQNWVFDQVSQIFNAIP